MKIVMYIPKEKLSIYNANKAFPENREAIKHYVQNQIDNDDDVIIIPECCEIISIEGVENDEF